MTSPRTQDLSTTSPRRPHDVGCPLGQRQGRLGAQRQRQAASRAQENAELRRRRLLYNVNTVPRTHNIACRPLDPALSRFSPGNMDVICPHCDASSFPNERYNCCHDGKVHIDDFRDFPVLLQDLFQSDSELAVNFRKNIRRYFLFG